MSDISKKVSYIKGLVDGMKFSDETSEGKVIMQLINVLEEAADEIDALWNKVDGTEDALMGTCKDIYDLQTSVNKIYNSLDKSRDDDFDVIYSDDDDDDDDFDFYDDEEDGLFEINCPECGEDIVIDFDMLDDENNIVCPNCHKEVELAFDFDDDDDESEDIDD